MNELEIGIMGVARTLPGTGMYTDERGRGGMNVQHHCTDQEAGFGRPQSHRHSVRGRRQRLIFLPMSHSSRGGGAWAAP